MKKFTILAALLMATTSAHAGNSISFEIDGHKVRIEAPKNCDQLSCIEISGFDFKSFNSKSFNDDDDVAAKSDTPAQKPAPVPATQVTAPQAPAAPATAPASTTVASTSPAPAADVAPPAASATAPAPSPPRPFRHQRHRLACGPRKRTREMFASSSAGRTSADMP